MRKKRMTPEEIDRAEDAADLRWLRAYRKKAHKAKAIPLEEAIKRIEESASRKRARWKP